LLAGACLAFCIVAASPSSAQAQSQGAPAGLRLTFSPESLSRALDGAAIERSTAVSQESVPDWAAEGRACEGCPRRRVWAPFVQTTIINVFYNLGNLARGEETAKVNPKTWWNNLKYGFEWDDNPFTTNQFGHPYQGNNYYTSARENGMSYWESSAIAAFGSAQWEYFGENNYASFNDFINTTLGGIALGEVFHRTAWLIRDTTKNDRGRLWQEIGATVLDPVGGANRFISGDASRVSEKPEQYVPSTIGGNWQFGALWQGDGAGAFTADPKVFLEADLQYGTIREGRSRDPFEAFTVNLRLGGGSFISDARVRGRLLGQPLGEEGHVQMNLVQSYDYIKNQAYDFGRQGFDFTLSGRKQMSSRLSAAFIGGVGVTVLGAINQVLLPMAFSGEEGEGESAPRDYDYGPGTTFGAGTQFMFDDYTFASVSYQGYQLYVVDGLRSNHVLQRVRLDLLVPIRGRLAAGVSGEFFYRKTYFQAGGEESTKYPQVRFFLAWRRS
jgi:hypothetical protein